jgi:dienelactone hydrolase
MRQRLVVALLAIVAAGCGGSKTSDPFAYDLEPLDVQLGSHVPANDQVVVQGISYASGDERVEGYLVVPRSREKHLPAVVFLHGAGGDREEQLAFAAELVERGAVALTITVPSRRMSPPADAAPEDLLRWQRDTVVTDVVATRRGFDLLAADGRVDAERLGLVGWSMGARLAAIVADVDPRARATVLMSGGAVPVGEYVDAAPTALQDDIEEVLPTIDPLTHVRTVRGALFVQAGRLDAIVPQRALRAIADAAPDGTRVTWYEADHALNRDAERDRLDWLSARLGIGS